MSDREKIARWILGNWGSMCKSGDVAKLEADYEKVVAQRDMLRAAVEDALYADSITHEVNVILMDVLDTLSKLKEGE